MPRLFRKRDNEAFERMFETRSHAWAAVGLEVEVDTHVVRKAWQRIVLTLPLVIATIVAENWAHDHFTHKLRTPNGIRLHHAVGFIPVSVGAVVIVLALGWLLSRDLSRVAPVFFRRMDPATAGTVGFLIRLTAMVITCLGALAVGGISLQALAVGGAFTGVVLGLAAQQPLGNLFAGMVLLSARPFRVGERVRLQAGALGGPTEGIVSQQGLLYTTLVRGEDRLQIPNTVVMAAVVVPIKEPDTIDVRVRLNIGVRPSQVQAILDANVGTPTRNEPRVLLEEIDGDYVVVRVQATPERHSDGAKLADEIITVLMQVTSEHKTVEQLSPDDGGEPKPAARPA